MASEHSSATLNALWKETYADSLVNLLPDSAKLLKKYPFMSGKKVGEYFVQPVIVTRSHGHTRGRGVQTLNDAIVHEQKQAQVNPMPDTLRELISYDDASRMVENKQAFVYWSKHLVKMMYDSMAYRASIEMLYGQTGLGQADGSTNEDTTHTVVDLTAASFAPGIFSGAENAKVKFYNGSTLISSGADAVFVIDSVDIDNKKLTVSGTTTGIAALDTALASATCDIFWSDGSNSAKGDYENAGFDKIITNTGSLFGIDASAYALWKGNTYSAGSANLTMAKVLAANAKNVGRGLQEDATVFVSATTYEKMNSDQAALRTYDNSYRQSKAEAGSEQLVYVGQNGRLTVEPCIYVKEGEAFIVPDKKVKRIGATDITFEIPGRGGEVFLNKDEKNAFELRTFSNQAYLIETPAQACKITGIVNS